ncbi:hypothetical protein OG579_08535 [Williamsia herbipolensis]|uniref:Uncharacterized protein n=1 Tax=Williamsia herbipolensis TaxID=1603258 RepID=A0AAU4K776_9NOCA|nr:hypothetical protein [Williamsia herbipolensis]
MGKVLWLTNFRNVPEDRGVDNESDGAPTVRITDNQRAQAAQFSGLLAEHAEALRQELAALRGRPDAQSQNRRTFLFGELREVERLTGDLHARWDATADPTPSTDLDDATDLPRQG